MPWWYMLIIPPSKNLKQEDDCLLEDSRRYTERLRTFTDFSEILSQKKNEEHQFKNNFHPQNCKILIELCLFWSHSHMHAHSKQLKKNHDNLQVQVGLASVFPNFFLSRGFLTYNEKMEDGSGRRNKMKKKTSSVKASKQRDGNLGVKPSNKIKRK